MKQDKILGEVINHIADMAKTQFPTDLSLFVAIFSTQEETFKFFFEQYFETIEGAACSVDKAGYTARAMIKTIGSCQNIPLQQTYREYRDKGGKIGGITELDKTCYWCPQTILDTETAFRIYFDYQSGFKHNIVKGTSGTK